MARFELDLLPVSFRPLVLDIAERMLVPVDYPAVIIVLALAGVVNRRAVIQSKEHDSGWIVVPNLWGGIVAPPGFMKSPVIQAMVQPMDQSNLENRPQLHEYKRVTGATRRDRTGDLLITNQPLYQLS